jgi:hypothetical protein
MSLPVIQRGIIPVTAGGAQSEFPLGSGVGFAVPGVTLVGLAVPANALLVVGVAVTTGDPGMPPNQTTALWGATVLSGTTEQMDGVGALRMQIFVRRTLVAETRTLTVTNTDINASLVGAIATYLIGPSSLGGDGANQGGASPGDLVLNLGLSSWGACYLFAYNAVADPGPWLAPARATGQSADLSSDGITPGWVSEAFVGPGPLGISHARKTINPPATGAWFGVWAELP